MTKVVMGGLRVKVSITTSADNKFCDISLGFLKIEIRLDKDSHEISSLIWASS